MAITNQCNNCKLFNGSVCRSTNVMPDYNQISCEQYTNKGIILDKNDDKDITPIVPTIAPDSDVTESISEKQGMFRNPFSFNGRIRRLEYGISYILMYIYAISIGFIVGAVDGSEGIMYLFLIPAYWFIWAQGAKDVMTEIIPVGINSSHSICYGCYSATEMNSRTTMVQILKAVIFMVNATIKVLAIG